MSDSDLHTEGLASLAEAEGPSLERLSAGALPGTSGLTDHWASHAPTTAARCVRSLVDLGHSPTSSAAALIVPGRIEVLGKHTDYAGGRSLLAAVERGFTLVSVARPDSVVRVLALDLGESREFPLAGDVEPASGWANYPMTVARRLARDFPGVAPGADIAMSSDLPLASGMSSSSALVVGTFLSLAIWSGLARDDRFLREVRTGDDLASYLAAIESAVWIAIGLSFTFVIIAWQGGTAGGEYLAGYLIAREGSNALQLGPWLARDEGVAGSRTGCRISVATWRTGSSTGTCSVLSSVAP